MRHDVATSAAACRPVRSPRDVPAERVRPQWSRDEARGVLASQLFAAAAFAAAAFAAASFIAAVMGMPGTLRWSAKAASKFFAISPAVQPPSLKMAATGFGVWKSVNA